MGHVITDDGGYYANRFHRLFSFIVIAIFTALVFNIFGILFITRTLFPFRCKSCFALHFLNKPQHFDTVLLLVYVVSKLVYPNCTHTVFMLFCMFKYLAHPLVHFEHPIPDTSFLCAQMSNDNNATMHYYCKDYVHWETKAIYACLHRYDITSFLCPSYHIP